MPPVHIEYFLVAADDIPHVDVGFPIQWRLFSCEPNGIEFELDFNAAGAAGIAPEPMARDFAPR